MSLPKVTQKGFPVAKHRSKFKSSFGQKNKRGKQRQKTTTRFREAIGMLKSMSEDEIRRERGIEFTSYSREHCFLTQRGRRK